MLLSIIIPLFNKAGSITATIDSILTQDFKDYEIIVVDDGSTDYGAEVVRSINDTRISLYRKENGGPSSARNFGLTKAKGDWVLFLDADDTLVPGALSLAEQLIKREKNVDIFTFNLINASKNECHLSRPFHATGRIHFPFLSWYLEKIYPRTGNMVAKRVVYLDCPYNEEHFRHEDTENTFCLMRKYRFYACDKPLFCYNQDTVSASHGRENLNEDYSCVMQPKGKPIIEQMAMLKLFREDTSCIYPIQAETMYHGEFDMPRIERWERIIQRYKTNKRRVIRLINRLIKHETIHNHRKPQQP